MHMKKISLLLFVILATSTCHKNEQEVFMFSYFTGNGEGGLHLAVSEDGFHWTALNHDETFLKPEVGDAKLMRDPCIIQGGDGRFHMVWTAGWDEKGVGYASSNDLLTWSEQTFIPVMGNEPNARNCWAPELFYDENSGQYLIYWATTIPGKFSETDSTGDKGYNHRIYFTTTKDFTHFSDAKILYDKGFNVIDASIVKNKKTYLMFLKNETLMPKPEKNIRFAKSNHLFENYSYPSESISPGWSEGPTAVKIKNRWIVYFDRYREHQMGAAASTDLIHWTDISDQISFPAGTRHGSVFKVKKGIVQKITGKDVPTRIDEKEFN